MLSCPYISGPTTHFFLSQTCSYQNVVCSIPAHCAAPLKGSNAVHEHRLCFTHTPWSYIPSASLAHLGFSFFLCPAILLLLLVEKRGLWGMRCILICIPDTYVYSLPDPDIGTVAVTYHSSASIAFCTICSVTISICTATGGALRSQRGQVDSMCAHADQALSSGGGHLEW